MSADDRYGVFDDPYCYRGTDILKNKRGLRDEEALQNFELEMTALRWSEPWPTGNLDAAHFRALHHHLFQDVYTWAGKYREVRMTRGQSTFCYPEYIAAEADKLFVRLRSEAFQSGVSRSAFVSAVTAFLAELNAIHCFRDGNGRTQLSMVYLIGERAGHPVRLERVKRETFLPAMIASFNGDLVPLTKEIAKLCRQQRRR